MPSYPESVTDSLENTNVRALIPHVTVFGEETFKEEIKVNEARRTGPQSTGPVCLQEEEQTLGTCTRREGHVGTEKTATGKPKERGRSRN